MTVNLPNDGNQYEAVLVGTNVVVQKVGGGGILFQAPLNSVSGLTVQGTSAADKFTVDYATGGYFALPINFNGGAPSTHPGDQLAIKGNLGSSSKITANFGATPDAGNLMIHPSSGADSTITYTGLEPIDMTGTTATDLVFNLPTVGGPTLNALLDDNGSSSRISGSTFETTTFADPSGSLTINRGFTGDKIQVNAICLISTLA